jgi:hypothetical protein
MIICPHEHYGHCRGNGVECRFCDFNPEKSDMPDPNERLDTSDYPVLYDVCPHLKRVTACTWLIKGECTVSNKFQCPEWQDTHNGELSHH